MTEPNLNPNIAALIARPSEQMTGGEVYEVKKALLNSVSMLSEAELYDEAAKLGRRDPAAAHELLVAQSYDPDFDAAFPAIRIGLMAWLVGEMKKTEAVGETRDLAAEVAAETVAGGPADRAREAAFRADPGRFLLGAERSSVRLLHAPGFGMLWIDGADVPWTYAALGKCRSDFAELYRFVEDGGYSAGVLVGPPEAENEIALPPGYRFVAVDVSAGGRAA